MVVYVVDVDEGVTEFDFGDIANLAQFERELNEMFEEWYFDYSDAMASYTEYVTNGGAF